MPNNVSFEEAASVPLGLTAAAIGLYHSEEKNDTGLTPSWEAGGEGKYKGKGILIFGGASSVGQYSE